MVSSFTEVSEGVAGIEQIVGACNFLKTHYGRLPAIRSVAIAIAGNGVDDAQAHHVDALAEFVRRQVRYLADPLHLEFIQTPDVMLLAIDAEGFTYGDCDDHCVLFAACAESLGIPAEIVGVMASPSSAQFDHVIVTVQLEGGSVDVDLVAKQGQQPVYAEKLYAS